MCLHITCFVFHIACFVFHIACFLLLIICQSEKQFLSTSCWGFHMGLFLRASTYSESCETTCSFCAGRLPSAVFRWGLRSGQLQKAGDLKASGYWKALRVHSLKWQFVGKHWWKVSNGGLLGVKGLLPDSVISRRTQSKREKMGKAQRANIQNKTTANHLEPQQSQKHPKPCENRPQIPSDRFVLQEKWLQTSSLE